MEKFNFGDNLKDVEKQYNLGKGEYFKVKDGANKIRLVSMTLPHPSTYKGKETFKWLCQVLDLSDGKIKPYFMPHKIYKDILALQRDPDYEFDGVPMPYNLNIQAENAGKMEVKYSVIPSPKRTEMTLEQEAALKAAPTVHELQEKIWEMDKNKVQTPADVVANYEEVNQKIADEINF